MDCKEVANKLLEIYYIYENYCFINKQQMIIIIEKGNIYFDLYKDDECVDEIFFKFSNNEKDKSQHDYIGLFLTIKIFGNVKIYIKGLNVYNNTHRPYVCYIINDEELLEKVKILQELQEKEVIDEESGELQKLYKKARKKYFDVDEDTIDRRIDITKKIIRGL